MALTIQAFANGQDAFIAWRAAAPIADCVGFELRRKRNGKMEVVQNRVSFGDGGADPDPTKPESSATSPIRRFTWTDHQVKPGDKVAYQVVAVVQPVGGDAAADERTASDFSAEVELTGVVDDAFECHFNRGFVMSQFASRFLKNDLSSKSLQAFKTSLDDTKENKIRDFFGGGLRARLIELLAETKKNKGQIFAALFELSDDSLIDGLLAMGKNAHVVLSNGAHKSRDDDENATARKALQKKCDVENRMLPANMLGHNKFMVICDAEGNPQSAWTGSTNWSPTGLCTQINNGILIHDASVAQIYLDQWNRLKDAGDAMTKDLVAANSEVKSGEAGGAPVDVWFTKTSDQQEMHAAQKLIEQAEDGIVFLMFQPGGSPLLDAIVARQAGDDQVFVNGVVSTANKEDMDKAQVMLVHRGRSDVHKFQILQPQGLHQIGKWATEISRGQFLNQIGFAIVHSKIIVIDANGKNPVVITGSHNFSASASGKNDENMVIIRGNAALAQAYAVNIQAVCDHYHFRSVAKSMQEDGKDVADFMRDPKGWQKGWFGGDKMLELQFWLGAAAKQAVA